MKRLINTASIGLTAAAAATLLGGCLGENRPVTDRPAAVLRGDDELSTERPTLESARLNDFGFTLYWDAYIPDERIRHLFLVGSSRRGSSPALYAFTESERLYQLDLQSGKVNWIYEVDRRLDFTEGGQPIAEWIYRPDRETGLKQLDEIFFVAQDRLYAIDKVNGSELWQLDLPFSASSAPAAGPTHAYVGAWNNRLYAIEKDNPNRPDWFYTSDGDIRAQPLAARGNVFVPSMDGSLHSVAANTGELRNQFETGRPLRIDPADHAGLIYLAADDYNLYVLRDDDESLVHTQNVGARITDSPVGVTDYLEDGTNQVTLFYPAEDQGLVALRRLPEDRDSARRRIPHTEAWRRDKADMFLAIGRDDVYLREPAESPGSYRIVRVDSDDGTLRDALDVGGVDFFVSNRSSPNGNARQEQLLGGIVILGFRNGWIMAMKETATLPSGALTQSASSN